MELSTIKEHCEKQMSRFPEGSNFYEEHKVMRELIEKYEKYKWHYPSVDTTDVPESSSDIVEFVVIWYDTRTNKSRDESHSIGSYSPGEGLFSDVDGEYDFSPEEVYAWRRCESLSGCELSYC